MRKIVSLILVLAMLLNIVFPSSVVYALDGENTVVSTETSADAETSTEATATEENATGETTEATEATENTETAETSEATGTPEAIDVTDTTETTGDATEAEENSANVLSDEEMAERLLVAKTLPDSRERKDVLEDNTISDFVRTNLHKGKELTPGTMLDLSFPIDINFKFSVPVKGDFLNGEGYDQNKVVLHGDYALVNLGKEIKYQGEPKLELRGNVLLEDGSKVLVGHLTLETLPDGNLQARFDFNGDERTYNGTLREVTVEALMSVEVKEEFIPNEGVKEIEIFGQKYTIERPKITEVISKAGELVTGEKNGVEYKLPQIKWTVEIEVKKTGGGLVDLNGYRFYDKIGVNRAGTGSNDNQPQRYKRVHSFTLNGQTIDAQHYNEATTELIYEFPAGTIGKQTFVYYTDLYDDDFYRSNTTNRVNTGVLQKRNKNTGQFEKVKEVYRIVYIPGRTWIAKRGYTRNVNNKEAVWQVYLNYTKEPLKNVRVKDVLPQGMTYKNAWLEHIAIPEGEATEKWIPIKPLADNKAEGEKITPDTDSIYHLGDIDKHVRLIIVVDVTNYNGKPIPFRNEATVILGGDGESISHNTDWEFTFGSDGSKKESTKNYWTDPNLEWKISVPHKVAGTSDKNIKVYDLLVYDVDTSEDFLRDPANASKVTGLPEGVILSEIAPFDLTHFKFVPNSFNALTPGVSFVKTHSILRDGKAIADLVEFEIDVAQKDASGAWEFTFKALPMTTWKNFASRGGEYWQTNSVNMYRDKVLANRVYGSTKYKPDVLYKQMLTVDSARAVKTNASNLNAVNTVVPEEDLASGFDIAALDAVGEGVVIFRLDINASNHKHLKESAGNLQLFDTLPDGWEFTKIGEKEFLVYEGLSTFEDEVVGKAKGQKWAKHNAVKLLSDAELQSYGIAKNKDFIGRRRLQIDFTKVIDRGYVVLLAARPNVKKIDFYKGKANENIVEINYAELWSRRTNKYTNQEEVRKAYSNRKFEFNLGLIGKSALSLTGLIEWTVIANPYNIKEDYAEYWLEDILGEGIELRKEANGKVVESDYQLFTKEPFSGVWQPVSKADYTFLYQDKTIKVKLPEKNKTYKFVYNTEVSAIAGKDVSNEVKVKGTDKELGSTALKYRVQTINAKVKYGINGSIEIFKKDQDGNSIAHAEFTLTNDDNGKTTKGVTSSLGTLIFNPIQPGSYTLKETLVPDGYVGSDKTTKEGYKVVVTQETVGGVLKVRTTIDGQPFDKNKIEIVNEKIKKANLSISKKVTGEGADLSKKFRFTISFTGDGADGEYDVEPSGLVQGDKVRNGSTFELSHGQNLVVKNLPIGLNYTVTEDDYTAQGYELTAKDNSTGTITLNPGVANFINTYTGKSLTVTKKWHLETKEPRDVKVKLVSRTSKNASFVDVVDTANRITAVYTLTENGAEQVATVERANNVVFTLPKTAFGGKLIIRNLPPVDASGNTIYYSVREVVNAGDTSFMPFVDCGTNDFDKILHNIETTPLKITKAWITEKDLAGKEATFTLKQVVADVKKDFNSEFAKSILELNNGKLTAETTNGETVLKFKVTEANADITGSKNWSIDLVLPKYDKNGTALVYTVVEEKVDGFHAGIVDPIKNNTILVKNIDEIKTSVTVTKKWKKPDTDATQDVKVQLYANGRPAGEVLKGYTTDKQTILANGLAITFSELPVYLEEDITVAGTEMYAGSKISYSVVEVTKLQDYAEPTYEGQGTNQVTITNTRKAKTQVSVTKKWVGKKLDSVEVELLQGGKSMDPAKVATLREGSWSHTFDNLEKYDTEGQLYEYTVVEKNVDTQKYNSVTTGNQTSGFTITNTNIEKVRIKVTKTWQAPDTEIPASLTVTLTDGATSQTVVLTAPTWSHTFDNLPRYNSNGNEIKYAVSETIDTAKFNSGNSGMENGFVVFSRVNPVVNHVTREGNVTFTNTIKGEVSVAVTKKWRGAINVDNVTIGLYRNGIDTGQTALLTGDKKDSAVWTHVFSGLAQYDGSGKLYTYTVKELKVGNDLVVYTGNEGVAGDYKVTQNDNTITNYNTTKIKVQISKTWVGNVADTQTITFNAVANGKTYGSVTLDKNNVVASTVNDQNPNEVVWEGEIANLPKFDEASGDVLNYTVEEVAVDGYDKVEQGLNNGKWTFMNVSKELISIPVTKKWVNSSIAEVTVRLMAGNAQIGEAVKLNEGNKWTHTFTDLPKFDKVTGAEINYTVTEDAVPNFKTEITGDKAGGFTVTNTYIPPIPPYVPETPGGEGETPDPEKPTPPTPPTTTPPTEEIPTEPTPEGEPNKPTPPVPPVPTVPEEEIPGEEVPEGKTELPKTDGIPAGMMFAFGLALSAIGFLFKREK